MKRFEILPRCAVCNEPLSVSCPAQEAVVYDHLLEEVVYESASWDEEGERRCKNWIAAQKIQTQR